MLQKKNTNKQTSIAAIAGSHIPCKMAFGIPRNKGVNFHGKFGLGIPWNS